MRTLQRVEWAGPGQGGTYPPGRTGRRTSWRPGPGPRPRSSKRARTCRWTASPSTASQHSRCTRNPPPPPPRARTGSSCRQTAACSPPRRRRRAGPSPAPSPSSSRPTRPRSQCTARIKFTKELRSSVSRNFGLSDTTTNG